MPYNLLTFLCKNAAEGASAAASFPPKPGMKRFFLFLDQKPEPKEIAWIGEDDMTLTLENAVYHPECEKLAVRAAILYADMGAWNLLFCRADDLPSEKEFDDAARRVLNSDTVCTEHLWGTTRESVVLSGFEAAYPQTAAQTQNDAALNEIEIGYALQGQACSEAAALLAVAESVPMQSVAAHQSTNRPEEKFRSQITKIAQMAGKVDNKSPHTVFAGSNITVDELTELRLAIPSFGAAVIFASTEDAGRYTKTQKPYRTITCKDGFCVLLYKTLNQVRQQ